MHILPNAPPTFLCEKKNCLSLKHSRLKKRKTSVRNLISEYCFITEWNMLSKFSSRNQHKLVHIHNYIHLGTEQYSTMNSTPENSIVILRYFTYEVWINSSVSWLHQNQTRKEKHRRSFSLFKDAYHDSTSNWTHFKNMQGMGLLRVYRVPNMIITCREVVNTA